MGAVLCCFTQSDFHVVSYEVRNVGTRNVVHALRTHRKVLYVSNYSSPSFGPFPQVNHFFKGRGGWNMTYVSLEFA